MLRSSWELSVSAGGFYFRKLIGDIPKPTFMNTTMSTTVLVIAPHLFVKKRASRQRLRRTHLNKSFMATDSNDTDPQLPDDTRSLQFMQGEGAADQAALGEGRVATDSYSDSARRRASDKTDSSDSSSAGACLSCFTTVGCDSCMLFTVSYFRPVQIMAEN
jgi:hypothetical protein